ncbi:MAG: hypothetical protein MI700_12400 [Balneolales bacterium]|nr:hypothetical protein [Balneolales bacterium]
MKRFKLEFSDFAILLLMIATAFWRIMISTGPTISSLANFTPLGAMALFGGAYFSSWRAFAFPLLTLWISDIIFNRLVIYDHWVLFYPGCEWVYGAFALMVLVGRWLEPNRNLGRFVGSSVLIVFIHWIVTDIGVWLGSTIYPQTIAGFWACLVAAIPFEFNLLKGTLLYGGILFGTFEWLKRRIPSLQPVTQQIS